MGSKASKVLPAEYSTCVIDLKRKKIVIPRQSTCGKKDKVRLVFIKYGKDNQKKSETVYEHESVGDSDIKEDDKDNNNRNMHKLNTFNDCSKFDEENKFINTTNTISDENYYPSQELAFAAKEKARLQYSKTNNGSLISTPQDSSTTNSKSTIVGENDSVPFGPVPHDDDNNEDNNSDYSDNNSDYSDNNSDGQSDESEYENDPGDSMIDLSTEREHRPLCFVINSELPSTEMISISEEGNSENNPEEMNPIKYDTGHLQEMEDIYQSENQNDFGQMNVIDNPVCSDVSVANAHETDNESYMLDNLKHTEVEDTDPTVNDPMHEGDSNSGDIQTFPKVSVSTRGQEGDVAIEASSEASYAIHHSITSLNFPDSARLNWVSFTSTVNAPGLFSFSSRVHSLDVSQVDQERADNLENDNGNSQELFELLQKRMNTKVSRSSAQAEVCNINNKNNSGRCMSLQVTSEMERKIIRVNLLQSKSLSYIYPSDIVVTGSARLNTTFEQGASAVAQLNISLTKQIRSNMCTFKEDMEVMNKVACFTKNKAERKQNIDSVRATIMTVPVLSKEVSREESGYYSLWNLRSSIIDKKQQLENTHSLELKKEYDHLNDELRLCLKEIEPNIADYWRNSDPVFIFPGLEKYFESLNNGQTPSLQERMSYEWLRLMSFSNYTGGGSPVHLARNGFYHSGNGETRCFCCNTSHSSWTYSDNVQETHRRISPSCPLVTGGIEINENISIESGSRGNQPLQRPANLGNGSGSADTGQGGSQSGVYSAARPDLPTSHGGFASNAPQAPTFSFPPASTALGISVSPFSFNPLQPAVPRPDPSEFRFPKTSSHVPPDVPSHVGQSAATVTSNAATGFSFGSSVNAPPPPAEFTFAQGTGQEGGGSDIISQLRALTLQQSIAQQPSDEPISGNPVIAPTQPLQIARHTGEDQLSISAQQPPETHDLPQNPARNQRTPGNESSGSAPPAQQTENADNIEITQLKHPRYRTMDVRMSSFRSWPNYLNQTPRQMAYAGFFHPGVADFARCFCCGGGLRNWEADDDPMVEHARWYPRCEYINRLKGSHFVQAVLRRHREHMAERQREQEVPQNTFLTPDPMSTSVAANLLEMGFTQERAREAILTVRRLRGRAEVSIEEVTAWMLDDGTTQNQGPPDRGTTVNPRDTVGNAPPQPGRPQTPASSGSGSFESAVTSRHDSDGHSSVEDGGQRQDRTRGSTEGATGGSKKGDKRPKSKSNKEDSSSDEKPKSGKQDSSDDDEKSKDKDKSSKEDQSSDDKSKSDKGSDQKKGKSKKDKKTKSRKGSRSPAPGSAEGATGASADVDTKSLKEENKLLKQMQVCKICMDKYVSITFLPCGHLVCCEDCAKSMRKCPICRKRIKGQVRTFMS